MQQRNEFHDLLIAELPRLQMHAQVLTRNSTAARDLVHDAVTNVLAARNCFAPNINFQVWAHRILYNRFISTMRKQHATGEMDQVSDALPSVGGEREGRLTLGKLRSAIDRLPPDQRAALVMVVLQSMNEDEIAEVTGCALDAVKSQISSARRQLQASLLGKAAIRASMPLRCFAAAPNRSEQL